MKGASKDDGPDNLIEQARKKMEDFRQLRSEIDNDVFVMKEFIRDLKKKIKDNIRSETNPDGLLTQKELNYFSNLVLTCDGLAYQLNADEAHWS